MSLSGNKKSFDVIVVGGGILGQSIARELALAAINVLLIYPSDHGGDSATLAAGAMIGAFGELTARTADFKDRQKLEFRIRAQERHPAWLDSLREESGQEIYTTRGLFMIGNNGGREDRANLKRIKAELDAYDKASEWVEPSDVPGLSPHDSYLAHHALFIRDDLTVDSAQLLSALTAILEASSYNEILDDRVVSIESHGSEAGWLVKTARKQIDVSAPNIVVCAGARIPAVLGDILLPKLKLPVLYFAKGIGCVVSGASPFPHAIRTPNRSDACGLHIVPRAHSRLYIGASNHYGYATAAARGITPGEVNAILGDTIREINTSLRDTTIEDLRFGLRPVSMDDLPLIGRTILHGLFLATGTFRTGIVMAPLISQLIAAEIQGSDSPCENPFAADARDRLSNGEDRSILIDRNLANLYADRGLNSYNQWKLKGDAQSLDNAIHVWREYAHLAGDYADQRIVTLLEQLESQTVNDVNTLY
jgi:Glycine/D-amino acid oxidases (deaminating)